METAQLEQRIATVEALIVENQRRVDAEPGNFAAALQLDSTKHHLDALRRQLRQARSRYRDAIAAWKDYKKTGLHITGEELRAWFRQLQTNPKTPPPSCHT